MHANVSSGDRLGMDVYAERPESPPGWAESSLARAVGFMRQQHRSKAGRLVHVLDDVARHGEDFRDVGEDRLGESIIELRRQLGHEGMTDELATRAFAVVRELSSRVLGMRHFDAQVLGGWAMLQGAIAEMQTGEGKTLTATLPACTAALAGMPVHVVTVNDYLAERDAQWLRPLYAALGLSVGIITEGLDPAARRAAYRSDVTYCTNKQVVFDYLRDRQVIGRDPGRLRLQMTALQPGGVGGGQLLLRGLHFAIVDEADSVLIDEARTPLILSQSPAGGERERAYVRAIELARSLKEGVEYRVSRQERFVELTATGKQRLTELAPALGVLWSRAEWREQLINQALSALELFQCDRHYLVRNGAVEIIDEYTGRTMPDRSWEQGLHQMVEVKEGCEVTPQPETLARISYQRFFRRYLRLAGMSGTAQEVASELWSVYRLKVMSVPTNRPVQRCAWPSRVYTNSAAKWQAVLERVRQLYEAGRPVLVGTRSVGASEQIADLLAQNGIPHAVLNARQDEHEAEIVSQAGQRGRVTVATNMAGRGTDIELGVGVTDLEGLHVIATERHDARRIDRQLFGRAGRQGDPGSYELMLSLDDDLITDFYLPSVVRQLKRLGDRAGLINAQLGHLAVALPQHLAERRHARMRRELFKADERVDRMLAFGGRSD